MQSHVSLGAAAIGDRLLRGRKDHVEERHHEYLPDLEAAEKAQLPGKLKIFFGYAAGTGKTYAMLQSAQKAKEAGIDVVAGYIEPHTRPETMALARFM